MRYPGTERFALQAVDLVTPQGGHVALIGGNGAGKSTLLKAAVGLLRLSAGTLRVFGEPVGLCRERVAYLPQRGEIDWRFPIDVRGLVLTGRHVRLGWLRRPGRADHELVAAALERMGIGHLASRQIGELSGGQQQRALLARVLAQQADLLLLDEPFTGVDDATRDSICALLDQLQDEGRAVVLSTHDLARVPHHFDEVVFLIDGHRAAPPDVAVATATGPTPVSSL